MTKRNKELKDTDTELEAIGEVLSTSEAFIENNQKTLFISLAVIVLLASGWLLFKNMYVLPLENEARESLEIGQKYFSEGDYSTAVKGDSVEFLGFESIATDYSITESANISWAYAGISYYKLGEYNKAIDCLESFDGDDDVLSYTVLGTLGDCYVQLNDLDKALNYFNRASDTDNVLVAPFYMIKSAKIYESKSEFAKAEELYLSVRDIYSPRMKGQGVSELDDIEKYIEQVSLKNGK